MQSGQRNARACKLSLAERRRLTEGWMEAERGGVCGFYLAGRLSPMKGFNYLYDQSLRGRETTHCRGVTDHTADNSRGLSYLEQLIAPVLWWCLEGKEALRDKMSNATGLKHWRSNEVGRVWHNVCHCVKSCPLFTCCSTFSHAKMYLCLAPDVVSFWTNFSSDLLLSIPCSIVVTQNTSVAVMTRQHSCYWLSTNPENKVSVGILCKTPDCAVCPAFFLLLVSLSLISFFAGNSGQLWYDSQGNEHQASSLPELVAVGEGWNQDIKTSPAQPTLSAGPTHDSVGWSKMLWWGAESSWISRM